MPKANKYTMIEKSHGNETESQAQGTNGSTHKVAPPDCTLSEELQELMRFSFRYGTPEKVHGVSKVRFQLIASGQALGKQYRKGVAGLKEFGDLILDPKLAQEKYEQSLTAVFTFQRPWFSVLRYHTS